MPMKKASNYPWKFSNYQKSFPKQETYSLTDQIRRSSRSICANIGEAYRKRKYKLHFISKLTDRDAENSETQIWLHFAFACQYIDEPTFIRLTELSSEVGRLLNMMIEKPELFMHH